MPRVASNRGRSSTSTLLLSRAVISATPIVRARAVAISIASGRPSSRRQRSTTSARSSSVTVAPASRHRSRNSCTDGHARGSPSPVGTANGASETIDSPGTSRGARLVATTVGWLHAPSTCTTADATASSKCSQLSTSNRTGRSLGELRSASNESKPSCWAMVPGTTASSSTRVGRRPNPQRVPTGKTFGRGPGERRLATPAGPTTVTRRLLIPRCSSSASSSSRPISELGAIPDTLRLHREVPSHAYWSTHHGVTDAERQ